MQQLAIINPEHATDEEVKNYALRHATRAVILDHEQHIAMLHVQNKKYYKLPGGGIKNQESEIEALKRECREEAGVEIEIVGEIGEIVEYRKIFRLVQTSTCYLARVVGEKGQPRFTRSESRDDMQLNWLPYDQIMLSLDLCATEDVEGRDYIVPRDKLFLETVRKTSPLWSLGSN